MNKRLKNLLEWLLILGMSGLGTMLSFLSWIAKPENLDALRKLVRM